MRENNPLDLVGGFENYQNRLYQAMRTKLLELPKEARAEIQEYVLTGKEFKDDVWSLRNGIEYFLEHQDYVTSWDFEQLACPLRLAQNELFHSELIAALTTPENPEIPTPCLVPEGNSLNKRTSEYIRILFDIQEASDNIIRERTTKTN